jgi:hypothetical protein
LLKSAYVILEDKLLNSNVSRTFYAQKLLPGAGATLEMFDNKAQDNKAAVAPKDFVRTSAGDQKMDRFLVKSNTAAECNKEQAVASSGATTNQECQLTSVKTLRQQLQVSLQISKTVCMIHSVPVRYIFRKYKIIWQMPRS